MQEIIIKENLEFEDFMKANFPQALRPFYKKRIFKLNVSFGIIYLLISSYIFYQGYLKGEKIQLIHLSFIVFTLIFFFLAYYLAKRENRLYREMFDNIGELETHYQITPDTIRVSNKEHSLAYKKDQLKKITDLDKWLVFDFDNEERLSIYKPNINKNDWEFIQKHYSKFIN